MASANAKVIIDGNRLILIQSLSVILTFPFSSIPSAIMLAADASGVKFPA